MNLHVEVAKQSRSFGCRTGCRRKKGSYAEGQEACEEAAGPRSKESAWRWKQRRGFLCRLELPLFPPSAVLSWYCASGTARAPSRFTRTLLWRWLRAEKQRLRRGPLRRFATKAPSVAAEFGCTCARTIRALARRRPTCTWQWSTWQSTPTSRSFPLAAVIQWQQLCVDPVIELRDAEAADLRRSGHAEGVAQGAWRGPQVLPAVAPSLAEGTKSRSFLTKLRRQMARRVPAARASTHCLLLHINSTVKAMLVKYSDARLD